MAKLFGEEAYKAIGDLALSIGWVGGTEKTTLDTLVGGIMSKLGGGSFASWAASAGFNELV
ncbi:MAG: fhaB 2 [Firmicutes bacterium]|nr:fhaB 2 [Bacillota bacterium]